MFETRVIASRGACRPGQEGYPGSCISADTAVFGEPKGDHWGGWLWRFGVQSCFEGFTPHPDSP